MITTMQISDKVKKQLLLLKKENQTFEDVIVSLLKEKEMRKQGNIDLIKLEAKELKEINNKISNSLDDVKDINGEIVEW